MENYGHIFRPGEFARYRGGTNFPTQTVFIKKLYHPGTCTYDVNLVDINEKVFIDVEVDEVLLEPIVPFIIYLQCPDCKKEIAEDAGYYLKMEHTSMPVEDREKRVMCSNQSCKRRIKVTSKRSVQDVKWKDGKKNRFFDMLANQVLN